MKGKVIGSCLLVLLAMEGTAGAGVDGFEDTGPNFTHVGSRDIEGATITISNASGLPYLSVTYFDTGSNSFVGAEDVINAPVDPARVSGDLFISTTDDINTDMPIVFEFSTPLGVFGLTTLDVLEDVETTADAEVRLQGFNGTTLVDEHVRSGVQGGSGIDLDWQVSSDEGMTSAVLVRTGGSISPGYGIDDMVAVTLPVPTVTTSFGQIKALFR